MAIDYTKQYRPVSTLETAQGDALSIRAIRDIADGINNYKACVGNHPIISEMFVAGSNRVLNNAVASYPTAVAIWAPRYFPHGYTRFTVQVCGKTSASAGKARFALYLFNKRYDNPGSGLFSVAGRKYAYATWDFAGEDTSYQCKFASSSHLSFAGQYVYPVLVASDEDEDVIGGEIASLVVRPMVYERI